jgi:hypothetical protein
MEQNSILDVVVVVVVVVVCVCVCVFLSVIKVKEIFVIHGKKNKKDF